MQIHYKTAYKHWSGQLITPKSIDRSQFQCYYKNIIYTKEQMNYSNHTDDKSTTARVHCTDNDQWVEADILSENDKNIVMIIQKTVRLSFHEHERKRGTWIANSNGYEFVYKQQQ